MKVSDLAMLELALRDSLDEGGGKSDVKEANTEIAAAIRDKKWSEIVTKLQVKMHLNISNLLFYHLCTCNRVNAYGSRYWMARWIR